MWRGHREKLGTGVMDCSGKRRARCTKNSTHTSSPHHGRDPAGEPIRPCPPTAILHGHQRKTSEKDWIVEEFRTPLERNWLSSGLWHFDNKKCEMRPRIEEDRPNGTGPLSFTSADPRMTTTWKEYFSWRHLSFRKRKPRVIKDCSSLLHITAIYRREQFGVLRRYWPRIKSAAYYATVHRILNASMWMSYTIWKTIRHLGCFYAHFRSLDWLKKSLLV